MGVPGFRGVGGKGVQGCLCSGGWGWEGVPGCRFVGVGHECGAGVRGGVQGYLCLGGQGCRGAGWAGSRGAPASAGVPPRAAPSPAAPESPLLRQVHLGMAGRAGAAGGAQGWGRSRCLLGREPGSGKAACAPLCRCFPPALMTVVCPSCFLSCPVVPPAEERYPQTSAYWGRHTSRMFWAAPVAGSVWGPECKLELTRGVCVSCAKHVLCLEGTVATERPRVQPTHQRQTSFP